jgi:hypothetical protein
MENLERFVAEYWALFINTPTPFFVTLGLGVTFGFFVANIRNGVLKERLDQYKEKLGDESPADLKTRIADLEAKVQRYEVGRKLSEEQVRILTSVLSEGIGAVSIIPEASCPDGPMLSTQFQKAFEKPDGRFKPASPVGPMKRQRLGLLCKSLMRTLLFRESSSQHLQQQG